MTMTSKDQSEAWHPFKRMVCAVDGSVESIQGVRQGWRLAPQAPATLVYVLEALHAPNQPADYPGWAHTTREAANSMLSAARSGLLSSGTSAAVDVAIEDGDLRDALRFSTTSKGVDVLLTIGSGDEKELFDPTPLPRSIGRRLPERVVEAVGCSALVVRCARDLKRFPESIIVGVDGSAPSVSAYQVASSVAQRSGAHLTVLTALGGKGPDLDALHRVNPHIPIDRLEAGHPAEALVEAAVGNDLIVVGNRGRHGLRALGSVSASVMAHSPVSVLVVRQP